MTYTNKFKLPKEIVEWLKNDEYDYNDDFYTLSATTLLKSARMILLQKRWKDSLSIDVSDLITQRYGTSLHDSFEKLKLENTIQEKRYYRKIGDFTISGKVDLILDVKDNPKLADLKSTSVWTYILGSRKDDFIKQLSIYRWILQDESESVNGKALSDKANIFYIFTDFSKKDAMIKKDYPQTRIVVDEIKLLSLEDTQKMIQSKIEQIKSYKDTPDSVLPFCTKEDLWQADESYAVMKKGASKATKLFANQHEAIKMKESLKEKDNYFITKREAKAKRCDYCSVSSFCNQYLSLKKQNLI